MVAGLAGCASSGGDDDVVVTHLEPEITLSTDGGASATLLDYGQVLVGTYTSKAFTIQNTGQATLHLSSVTLKNGGSSSAQQNFFEITQAPASEVLAGSSTTVKVKFWAYQYNSTGTSDVVQIDSDDPSTPHVEMELKAVVVKPKIGAVPTSLNFNDVSTTDPETKDLTLQNLGDGKLTLTELTFDSSLSSEFSYTLPAGFSLPGTIDPGRAITVKVTYAPTDGSADKGNLTIASNDPDQKRLSVPITGNGEVDTPPVVLITSPVDGDSYYTGSQVKLAAQVTDVGTDPDKLTLFWTSSLEGQLCTGVTATPEGLVTCTATLSKVGTQVITLVALDAAKQTGTDSVSITLWDEQTPLNYVISGSPLTSLYAFTPDDNLQIWVVDGVTGEQASSPCVFDMDDTKHSNPPSVCNAKYGDYIHVLAYDRYGHGADVPQLYLWYGQNDEWSQPIVADEIPMNQGNEYYDSLPCEPLPTKDEWLNSDPTPAPGTHPDDCLIYDNATIKDPTTGEFMIKITIPPPDPSQAP